MKTDGSKLKTSAKYWWVALNGSAVAWSPVPMASEAVDCFPTPQVLFGYLTREDQAAAQEFLLRAPIAAAQRYCAGGTGAGFPSHWTEEIWPTDPMPPEDTMCWQSKSAGMLSLAELVVDGGAR